MKMGQHEDPNQPEPVQPDPGNSPPEAWTEPMTAAEIDEVVARLQTGGTPKEEAAPQGFDFSVLKED